jgi:NADPH:quinone reductase-like Zn-dependent oxidoreductase
MRAAVVHSFNAPPSYTEFPDPVASEGEVAVTVTAAGLHRIVRSLASGSHYGSTGELPFIPGVDGVGRLASGARVLFGALRSPFGTFAERAAAPGYMLIPLPDGIADEVAAGIANPAMSSWAALTARAKFIAGESVLVLGATGVSGRLAVQIAKRLGASRVVAAGRNAQALAELEQLGADAVISLELDRDALVAAFQREHAHTPFNVVLDYLWGQPAECAIAALAQRGLSKAAPRVRFIQIGSTAGLSISLPAAALRSSGLELLGSGFGSASLEQLRAAIADFFASAAAQPFQFEVEAAPLSEIEARWNTPEGGKRLVFVP